MLHIFPLMLHIYFYFSFLHNPSHPLAYYIILWRRERGQGLSIEDQLL